MFAILALMSNFAHATTHPKRAVNYLIQCVLVFAHPAMDCVKSELGNLQWFNKLSQLGIK